MTTKAVHKENASRITSINEMIDAPKIHNVLYLVAALSWSVKNTDALIRVHYRIYANVCVASPQCKHLVWALETQHSGLFSPGTWYWLDIGNETSKSLGIDKIVASYDLGQNRVVVEQAKDYLCILLNEHMLDYQKDVYVLIGGQQLVFRLTASRTVQEDSLKQRNDWRMIFSARITLTQQDGTWHGFSSE